MKESVGRDFAAIIVSGWLDDGALVRVEIRREALIAAFFARVLALDGAALRVGLERSSDAVLPFAESASFLFDDFREAPEHEAKFVRELFIFPSGRTDDLVIVIAELRGHDTI